MRSVLSLLAAMLVLGAASAAAQPGITRSGLRGLVTEGPTQPVCRDDDPCERPAAGLVLSFSRRGAVRRTRTDAEGRYRIRLRPGIYSVRVSRGISHVPQPARVHVTRGPLRRLDFSVDTGIR